MTHRPEVPNKSDTSRSLDTSKFAYVLQLPRLIPRALRIRSFGWVHEMEESFQRDFDMLGFSFLIRGSAHYFEDGRKHTVEAPCLFRQMPGHQYVLHPIQPLKYFYVTYEASTATKIGSDFWNVFVNPFRSLPDMEALATPLKHLTVLSQDLGVRGGIDRIEQFFEQLLLETTLEIAAGASGPKTVRSNLEAARRWIEGHSTEQVLMHQVAKLHSVSERTFRRKWVEFFGNTPTQYLMELRIRNACYLLLHSEESVTEIGYAVGFNDPSYFVRTFNQVMGLPPGRFRKANPQRSPDKRKTTETG